MDPNHYGTAGDPGQTERITDPARIAQLLKRLKDSRALLSVTVPAVTDVYLSAVLGVDAAGGSFELDELAPPDGHPALLAAGRLNAFAQCSGVDLSFTAALRSVERDSNGNFYRLAFPAVLFYRQRREHYRVRVARGQPVPLVIGLDEQHAVEGLLHDISAGGLGGEFERYQGPALVLGQVLPDCELRLHDHPPLHLSLEVRFVSADEPLHRLRLGARFLELGRQERKLIEQFVASLDREWRRRLSRNRDR
jgi:c-di-GMP-binding flagellar brake protein YcgR